MKKGYTRIDNKLLEAIMAIQLNSTETACLLFLIRKLYGYRKTSDYISYSQISQGIYRSKRSVVRAMQKLKDVNIVTLVEVGGFPADTNKWRIQSDISKWGDSNPSPLVTELTLPPSDNIDTTIGDSSDTTLGDNIGTYKRKKKKEREKGKIFSAQPQSQQLKKTNTETIGTRNSIQSQQLHSSSQANSYFDDPGIPLDKLNFGDFTLAKDENES